MSFKKNMRIAVLGSVALPVPPLYQGGTEWIAYYQAKGLAEKGHQVILFAARGSEKDEKYELVEVGGGDTVVGSNLASQGIALRSYEIESSRPLRKENIYLAQVIEQLLYRKNDYDLILNNMRGEAVFLPVAKLLDKAFINVMHLPIFPELADIFKKYNTHIITISNAQRKNFPDLNYLATVYNCVDMEKYVMPNSFRHPFRANLQGEPQGILKQVQDDKKSDFLLMMGSISPHKNQAGAIRVAKKSGMKLILAGKINDQKYFDQLKKDIDEEQIKWVGELGFEEKLELYQNAKAFIFPILWQEPFGLVMIEAMAAGTPVVAFGNGAVPEVVVDGVTGFVVKPEADSLSNLSLPAQAGYLSHLRIKKKGIEGLVEAVKRINAMSPEEYRQMRINCRKHVEENFTVEKMVKYYEEALLRIEKTITPRCYS